MKRLRERLAQWIWPGVAGPKALELKRGGVYVIEARETMDVEEFTDLEGYLKKASQQTGCQFVVLDAGFRIATIGGEK